MKCQVMVKTAGFLGLSMSFLLCGCQKQQEQQLPKVETSSTSLGTGLASTGLSALPAGTGLSDLRIKNGYAGNAIHYRQARYIDDYYDQRQVKQ